MKDNFSGQSALYAKYRPAYPWALYDFVLANTAQKQVAWDCGTGNGQAAKELARVFEKVFATDISQGQVDQAERLDNVFYSVQAAEKTNFPGDSFDLVVVAQALHWFRFDDFYSELNRVARPGSTFAAWTYSLLRIESGIDRLVDEYHYSTMARYWDAERKYVDDEYRTIPFPFEKIETPTFYIHCHWTIDELEGYFNTWSALQKFVAANQYNPVPELIARIRPLVPAGHLIARFPVHVLMARLEK